MLNDLIALGAKPRENVSPYDYQYSIPTRAGTYVFNIYPDHLHGAFLYAPRGYELTGTSNPYTGKWNHYWDGKSYASVLRTIKAVL